MVEEGAVAVMIEDDEEAAEEDEFGQPTGDEADYGSWEEVGEVDQSAGADKAAKGEDDEAGGDWPHTGGR